MTFDEAVARVLVVDDAPTVRLYHAALLSEAGFDVQEAENGLEAIEAALSTRFDLFLVDVNMPMMDGYACVETLRSERVGTSAPVLMISAEEEPGDAELAYLAGANLYLIKPVAPDHLVRVATMLITVNGEPA